MYDVVENEPNLIGGIGDDLPLQEVIIARENFLQLTFLLPLQRIDHVLRTVQYENSRILFRGLEIGSIVAQPEVIQHLFDILQLSLRFVVLVELHALQKNISELDNSFLYSSIATI